MRQLFNVLFHFELINDAFIISKDADIRKIFQKIKKAQLSLMRINHFQARVEDRPSSKVTMINYKILG